MFPLDHIKSFINSRSQDFLDYLKVYIIDDKGFEILESVARDANIYIIGGVIRDYFLGRIGAVRDLDFVTHKELVVYKKTYSLYRKLFSEPKFNSFKGLKLQYGDSIKIDIWQLSNTWGINKKGVVKPTPNALIDSVFFNFSAIIYDFVKRKFIFNDHFASFVLNKEINIVYEENPNIPLCLFNLFYYPRILGLRLSEKAKAWIKKHLDNNLDFAKIQNQHLGKVIYSTDDIMKNLQDQIKQISDFGIDWDLYLSAERFKEPSLNYDQTGPDKRSAFESDFGRVVFSSAIRRMHDKTQVIPLTSGDKIHTRLTHSIEVMNVAQSLAFNLCRDKDFIQTYGEQESVELERNIGAILKTAAFVHDIGNPPFGHFGETVIKNFFKRYLDNHILCDKYKIDYEEFDGNAQGFRILTHLSYIGYLSGLNLTYGTLGAYLKYPNSGKEDKSYIGTKKHGVYGTEREIFEKIVEKCHLKRADERIKRHPLSFLVEAADSICYNVMDIEDGYLLHWYDKDTIIKFLDNQITKYINENIKVLRKKEDKEAQKQIEIYNSFRCDDDESKFSFLKIIYNNPKYKESGDKLNRVHWIMNFRVKLISYLIELASRNFKGNIKLIDKGDYNNELIEDDCFFVAKSLQKFTQRYIFPQSEIQRAELTGHSVLNGLLNFLLQYVSSNDNEFRKRVKNLLSKSSLRLAIHENENTDHNQIEYKNVSKEELFNYDLAKLSENAKLRIVVDFISGMTDKYAVHLYQQLSGLKI